MAKARRGFFPIIVGDQVSLQQGGAVVLAARDDLAVSQGGGQVIGAGNSISVSQGGSWIMGAGSGITVDQGGAGLVAGRHVRADRSIVGMAIGGTVEIEDSDVMFGSVLTLMAGVAVGLLVGWLSARKP